MAFPASVTTSLPPVLVAANRPRSGRTLFSLMLADWLGNVQATPCALADADAAGVALARLSQGRAVTLAGSRLDGKTEEVLVVDNADALWSERTGSTGRRGLDGLADWLKARPAGGAPPLLCLLVEDGRDADRGALHGLRETLPRGAAAGMVVVRNAGMPPILPTEADQRHAGNGGWPTCPERQAWLEGGAREMVFARPPAALVRQTQILGAELCPDLGGEPRLWLNSRQQFLRWRRDFAARATRAFGPLWPRPLGTP